MGLDLIVSDAGGSTIIDFNTLRNPFGLLSWIADNVQLDKSDISKITCPYDTSEYINLLEFVCNHWSYNQSDKVDRKLFLDVISMYNDKVQALTEGYFFFNFRAYRELVEHRTDLPCHYFGSRKFIEGETYVDGLGGFMNSKLRLPMHIFKESLDEYKKWSNKLLELAKALQDPCTTFYCSN